MNGLFHLLKSLLKPSIPMSNRMARRIIRWLRPIEHTLCFLIYNIPETAPIISCLYHPIVSGKLREDFGLRLFSISEYTGRRCSIILHFGIFY